METLRPDPDIITRRCATSERIMTAATASKVNYNPMQCLN
jgi:hypothetical protein